MTRLIAQLSHSLCTDRSLLLVQVSSRPMAGMDKPAWHMYCPPWDVSKGDIEIFLQMVPPKVVMSATTTPGWPTLPPPQFSVGDCTKCSTTGTEQLSSMTSPAVSEAGKGSITGTSTERAGGRKRTQPVSTRADSQQFYEC